MAKHRSKSFEQAVIQGDIIGPNWPVINTETGEYVEPGDQDFRGNLNGRSTGRIVVHLTNVIGTVEDFQFPANVSQPE